MSHYFPDVPRVHTYRWNDDDDNNQNKCTVIVVNLQLVHFERFRSSNIVFQRIQQMIYLFNK